MNLSNYSCRTPSGLAKPCSMELLAESLRDLRLILENRDQILPDLIARPIFTPGKLFSRLHLPLCITFPLGIGLSPFTYILGWSGVKYILIFTIMILVGAVLLAIVTDKISETYGHREVDSIENPLPKNVALFMQLPLFSAGIFYILHPVLGLMTLIMIAVYCFYTSIDSISLLLHVSRARALSFYFQAIILFLIPLVLIDFLFALYKSFYYLF